MRGSINVVLWRCRESRSLLIWSSSCWKGSFSSLISGETLELENSLGPSNKLNLSLFCGLPDATVRTTDTSALKLNAYVDLWVIVVGGSLISVCLPQAKVKFTIVASPSVTTTSLFFTLLHLQIQKAGEALQCFGRTFVCFSDSESHFTHPDAEAKRL